MATHDDHAIPLLSQADTNCGNTPKTCRICGEGDTEDEEATIGYSSSPMRRPSPTPSPLIRPCHCQGSMMYVHISCLNHWRTVSVRPSSSVTCDICGYEYNIHRPRYAALLTHPSLLRLLSLCLVCLCLLSSVYLCKAVDRFLLWNTPDDPGWFDRHGPTLSLGLDRFYMLGGAVVVAMVGLVYLIWLFVTHPDRFPCLIQHDEDGGVSFLCCDQSTCPWYCCYLVDIAICSGDSALGGIVVFMVVVALLVILFGLMGAVTGMFRLIESWVNYTASHIKNRIVDVET